MNQTLEARLEALEVEFKRLVRRRKQLRAAGAIAGAALLVLVAAGAVADPASPTACAPTRSNLLYCFLPDAPARASDINSNFENLAAWIDQKIGPANPADPEAAPTGTSGLIVVGSGTGSNLSLDGDEVNARNNGVAAPLFLQRGPSAGDTRLNADFGNVIIGSGGPNTAAKLQVNGVVSASQLEVGSGGTRFARVVMGTYGTCSVPGSAPAGQPTAQFVPFGVTFGTAPSVWLQPQELDTSGCTSVRIRQTTTTGFEYQAWTGNVPTACDCIQWIAFGQ